MGCHNVLLEDNLLRAIAGKGVSGAAYARLAVGERSVALETGFDNGEPRRISGQYSWLSQRGMVSLLVSRWELQVNADSAVLSGVGW